MGIRKTLFWFHLIIGCSAAVFIFLMSITGVALTYERQMIQAGERADYEQASEYQSPLPVEQLLHIAKQLPSEKSATITLTHIKGAPVIVREGRKTLAYLSPYTGEEVTSPGAETKSFFRKLRAFHRWLTFDGSFSENGRLVNGIANLIFVLLVVTGLYLWLPKKWKSRAFKQRLTLANSYSNKSAKHTRWHNVFGIYMTPILFIVATTALFFSFKWPGQTLKEQVSTESIALSDYTKIEAINNAISLSIDQQIATVSSYYPNWRTLRFAVEDKNPNTHIFHIDNGNGGEPQKRVSLVLDEKTGEIIREQKFEDLSSYRKIRSYIRFLHTGEVYGLVGQTLAGIASLLACILVYTGISLSFRRWKNYKARQIK